MASLVKRMRETMNAQQVVQTDLDAICEQLAGTLPALCGKRLLITGGAGFLGYYLVQTITHWNAASGAQPIDLTIYDKLFRGMPSWLEPLRAQRRLTLVRHDITAPLPLDIEPFHYVIHAASLASPTYYRMQPIETMDANVNGLRLLLDEATRQQRTNCPVEGLLFFSSSEIYGDASPDAIPTPESYRGNVSSIGPRACYDESKRYGETLCVNFARQHHLPITIVRPFNNYGPGLKLSDRRVIPDFAQDVLNGRDIVLLSDGSPTRTFCYVADAVVGYYKLLVHGQRGEAYNIGVETPEISIGELAQQVVDLARELFHYPGCVTYQVSPDLDYLTDNPNRRCPLIAKARADVDYAPRYSLREGLQRSLIWYDSNRSEVGA